ncbi:MAG: insulinase family protein, partial [Polyangiaceae bacterium]
PLGASPKGGLMQLGDVALAGAADPLRLLRPGAWATATPIGDGAARTATIANRHLEQALGFLHATPHEEEALASGVTLRLERDSSTPRVAITVSLGKPHAQTSPSPPTAITTEPVWESRGELRHTEVVRPTDIDVGLRVAVSRLGLWLAQSADASGGATRAMVNRHRRVAVGRLPDGEAWLALTDLMFPAGDAHYGRLVDPRGVDGAWLADRLLLSEQRTARRPSDATITVAGSFDPQLVRDGARSAIAALGLGIAGRVPVPPTSAEPRRIVELAVPRTELLLAQPFPGLDADDHAAALVALEVLAGSKRSAVRGALVQERLVDAYDVAVDLDWGRSVAVLRLTIPPKADPDDAERALDRLIAHLADEGPTGVELAYAQTMVRSRLGKRLKASRRHRPAEATSATRLLEAVRPGTLAGWHRRANDVSRQDVRRALRIYFEARDRVVVEIRPSRPGEVAKR